MNMSRNHKKGFTLIELLVVIAIIAILAAILFPVFARARENARRASCTSNVKQIMLGVMQYSQDYDEKYLMAHKWGAPLTDYEKTWMYSLQPYLKSTQILRCPSDSVSTANSFTGYRVSYIVNCAVTSGWAQEGFGDNGTPISLAAVENPAATVYMTDGGSTPVGGIVPANSPTKANTTGFQLLGYADMPAVVNAWDDWNAPTPRHLETAVVGFADGHVKSMRVENFYGAQGTPKGDCLKISVGCR